MLEVYLLSARNVALHVGTYRNIFIIKYFCESCTIWTFRKRLYLLFAQPSVQHKICV